MGRSERRKGRDGEAEVAAIFRRYGFEVRGLEGSGDHLVFGRGLRLHVESKRCETARPWAWIKQAEMEAPLSTLPVVAFRRSHEQWYAIVPLAPLLDELDVVLL